MIAKRQRKLLLTLKKRLQKSFLSLSAAILLLAKQLLTLLVVALMLN